MSEQQEVTRQAGEKSQQTPDTTRVIRPPVDVFEDATGITLQADMPGVTREQLDIKIDKDTLSIEGGISLQMPEGMEPLYADVRATQYQRTFSLSGEMDAEKVEATLKDGVLTLRIPKREEHKPRKIEVRVG